MNYEDLTDEERYGRPQEWNSLEAWQNAMEGKMSKKWYHSKTLWVNVIAVVAAIIVNFNVGISEEIMASEAAILGVINLILRLATNQGISS